MFQLFYIKKKKFLHLKLLVKLILFYQNLKSARDFEILRALYWMTTIVYFYLSWYLD